MHKFTDAEKREWCFSINVQSVREVRDATDVDLLEAIEGDALERLASDPVQLANVLWVLVAKQAADLDPPVTDESFGRALAGDVIDDAVEAFLAELLCFFPKGRRGVLTAALGKMREIETRLQDAAIEKLNSPAMEAIFDNAIKQMDGLIAKAGKAQPSERPQPGG